MNAATPCMSVTNVIEGAQTLLQLKKIMHLRTHSRVGVFHATGAIPLQHHRKGGVPVWSSQRKLRASTSAGSGLDALIGGLAVGTGMGACSGRK